MTVLRLASSHRAAFRQASTGQPRLGLVDAGILPTTGTVLAAATRGGNDTPMTVASLPLVPHRYFRG